jgi:hypothetical protein
LQFKRRTNKETTNLSAKTALLVQALKTIGEDRISNIHMEKLSREFSPSDIKTALREAKYSTAWVYDAIKRLKDRQEKAYV